MISHSINKLPQLTTSKTMGAFIGETHEYFLVVKSVENLTGSFTLKLGVEYRSGIIIAFSIFNIIGIVYVFRLKKKRSSER